MSHDFNLRTIMTLFFQKLVFLLAVIFFVANIFSKVSIITSVYNGDEYIKGFLEDVTKQTIFDQCELILVNANSPGNEEPVILEFLSAYSNIRYYRLDKDPGLYGAWNFAIRNATGDFITNTNIDDRLSPDCYQIHLQFLLDNPQIDLVYSGVYITQDDITFQEAEKLGSTVNFWADFSQQALYKSSLPNNHPMWRKSLHDKFGYFDESYKSAGDWEFWLRLAQGGVLFRCLHKILATFYLHNNNLSFSSEHNHEIEIITNLYKNVFFENYTINKENDNQ